MNKKLLLFLLEYEVHNRVTSIYHSLKEANCSLCGLSLSWQTYLFDENAFFVEQFYGWTREKSLQIL